MRQKMRLRTRSAEPRLQSKQQKAGSSAADKSPPQSQTGNTTTRQRGNKQAEGNSNVLPAPQRTENAPATVRMVPEQPRGKTRAGERVALRERAASAPARPAEYSRKRYLEYLSEYSKLSAKYKEKSSEAQELSKIIGDLIDEIDKSPDPFIIVNYLKLSEDPRAESLLRFQSLGGEAFDKVKIIEGDFATKVATIEKASQEWHAQKGMDLHNNWFPELKHQNMSGETASITTWFKNVWVRRDNIMALVEERDINGAFQKIYDMYINISPEEQEIWQYTRVTEEKEEREDRKKENKSKAFGGPILKSDNFDYYERPGQDLPVTDRIYLHVAPAYIGKFTYQLVKQMNQQPNTLGGVQTMKVISTKQEKYRRDSIVVYLTDVSCRDKFVEMVAACSSELDLKKGVLVNSIPEGTRPLKPGVSVGKQPNEQVVALTEQTRKKVNQGGKTLVEEANSFGGVHAVAMLDALMTSDSGKVFRETLQHALSKLKMESYGGSEF